MTDSGQDPRGKGTIPETHRSALVLVPPDDGRDVVTLALQKEGFRYEVARNVFDAYSLFLRNPAKLFIASLAILRRRDRQLLRELQRISPDLRLLLLVPDGRRGDVGRFLRAGGDSVLATPCSTPEIRFVVRALLRSDSADPLTGLPNRAAFRRAFDREGQRAKREENSLALGLFDLDDFKSANTEYGYRLADGILVEASRRLREMFRVVDLVARWGGEEFTVLLTGLPKEKAAARKQAATALDRARENMKARPIEIRGPDGTVIHPQTFSAGFALLPHDHEPFQELFDLANERLAVAKQEGKDRIVGD